LSSPIHSRSKSQCSVGWTGTSGCLPPEHSGYGHGIEGQVWPSIRPRVGASQMWASGPPNNRCLTIHYDSLPSGSFKVRVADKAIHSLVPDSNRRVGSQCLIPGSLNTGQTIPPLWSFVGLRPPPPSPVLPNIPISVLPSTGPVVLVHTISPRPTLPPRVHHPR
jgi:hypothetical protein